jgi:acyl carrier protein
MESDIEQKIRKIIVEQLGVQPEDVKPDARFVEDLGADSLDNVELIMALEEAFNFEIPDEDAERMRKVEDVVEYIKERWKPGT